MTTCSNGHENPSDARFCLECGETLVSAAPVAPTFEPALDGQIVGGAVVASPGRRFQGLLLEILLAVVTLGIGWLIWFSFTAKTSQTPAKRILKMRVVSVNTTQSVTANVMWVRTVLIGLVLSILASILDNGVEGKANDLVSLISLIDALFVFSVTRQRLVDRILKTQVLDER
jgi:uncharacterized RDD family membrane protein YckC